MKIPIIKKAWSVKDTTVEWEFDAPDENWENVYAKTSGKAKQMCSEQNSFITTRCKRAKGMDVVLFEGHEIKRHQMLYDLNERKRIAERTKKVLQFPESEMFYIQNGFVGNSCMWWGLNSNGYTSDINKAQKYTRQEVLERFVKSEDKHKIWSATHVLENVKQHVDAQYLNYKFVA